MPVDTLTLHHRGWLIIVLITRLSTVVWHDPPCGFRLSTLVQDVCMEVYSKVPTAAMMPSSFIKLVQQKPSISPLSNWKIWSLLPSDFFFSKAAWQAQKNIFIPCPDLVTVYLCGFCLAFVVKLVLSKNIQWNWKGYKRHCCPRELKKQNDRVVEVWFSEIRQMHGKLKSG